MSMTSTVESSDSNTTYFADIEFDSPKFAAEAFAMAEAWVQMMETSGIARRMTTNQMLYQGVDPTRSGNGSFDEGSFQVVGDNGELLYVAYNDFRNLLQHILNMTVSQPPNVQAKAINDDAKSLVATQTFDGVFDYYFNTYDNARLLKSSRQTVEWALVNDTGYTLVEYDPYGGKPIGTKAGDDGQPIVDERGQTELEYEGDMYFKARSPWDVFFDPGCEDENEADWVLVRDQINKFELAKMYPDHATRILSSSGASSRLMDWRRGVKRATKTNMIDVWKFYHRPTRGMPKGRWALMLDEQTVLKDGANPYDCLPVFSIRAMDGLGSMIGYAPANTLAPIQMSQNILNSAQMTNYAMFGVQNIAVKDSDQFDVTEIAGGMNIWKYAEAPPQGIQLAKQAEGIDEFETKLSRKGETLSGVNSVVRGDPDASLKSGKALGIVQAAAVQFQNALASSYAQYLKAIGNFMLQVFRKYFKTKRITQIVGENSMRQSESWDGDAFGPVDRVACELVDPAMRTLGYRTDLAMFMAQNNLTTTPQEFLTVLTTGQLKPMYRGGLSSLNLCHQENEDMQKQSEVMEQQLQQLQAQSQQQLMQATQQVGNNPQAMQMVQQQIAQQIEMQKQQLAEKLMPPVLLDDDDDLHLAEHAQVTNNVATRRNGAVTAISLAHRQAHMDNKSRKAQMMAVEQAKTQALVQQQLMQMGIMPQPMGPGGQGNENPDQAQPQNPKSGQNPAQLPKPSSAEA